MTKIQELLNILLREMIEIEKQSIREELTHCLCAYSVRDINPNEIDSTKTFVKSMDNNRYYIGVTTKKGMHLIVPLNKRHFNDHRINKIRNTKFS